MSVSNTLILFGSDSSQPLYSDSTTQENVSLSCGNISGSDNNRCQNNLLVTLGHFSRVRVSLQNLACYTYVFVKEKKKHK